MNKLNLVFFISFLYVFPMTSFADINGNGVTPMPSCTIDFDSVCPDTQTVCSTRARGGNGCVVEGLGNCYSTGAFAYEVGANDRAEFKFKRPVTSLRVFFATEGEGDSARMTFFDENGLQVRGRILTNGDCSGDIMPDSQEISFSTPIARVRIRTGNVPAFIDTMELNPIE